MYQSLSGCARRWCSRTAAITAASLALWGAAKAQAATFTAADSAAFTSLLGSTSLGDTIVLNAGTTYTGTFTLPVKTGSGYLTIQSSALGSLPAAGVRVNMSHAGNMPNIVPGNVASSAIKTAAGAHHYKLIGLEIISYTSGIPITNDLVMLGDPAYTSMSQVPSDLVIDRCIVRASTSTQLIKRGIALNSMRTDIINSYITGIKMTGADAQAIGGWNGPGPFNIINNFLEGTGENVMFGGASVNIPNLIPSDIVIKRNHFYKPLTWNKWDPSWDQVNWVIKNILEFKNGQRVLVSGNVFENHWAGQGQPGWSIVLTPRGEGGQAPWVAVRDIDFVRNIVRNVSAGPNIMGEDDDPNVTTQQTSRIKFADNLFFSMGGTLLGGVGKLYQISADSQYVTINHNTQFPTSTVVAPYGAPSTNFVFMNNIQPHNTYGILGSGSSVGNATLNTYFPGCIFTKNVLQGGNATNYNQYPHNFAQNSEAFPSAWSGVLVNQGTPGSNFAGWRVVNGSVYDNTGLKTDLTPDGRDIGADIDTINAATAGAVSGTWTTDLIARDSFNYTGSLGTQNGGTGFGTNPWVQTAGLNNPAIATGTMTYTDGTHSLSSGVILGGNKVQPVANSRATRDFPSALVTSGKTYWASFRIRQTGASFPTNHAGFSLFSGTAGAGTEIFMGKPGSATNWGIFHSGTGQSAVKSGTASMDAFIVVKMVFTGTQVTISMWVNPILSEAYLGTPHAQLVNQAHTTNIASLRLSAGTNSSGYQFDEFRLGTGFLDVAE